MRFLRHWGGSLFGSANDCTSVQIAAFLWRAYSKWRIQLHSTPEKDHLKLVAVIIREADHAGA